MDTLKGKQIVATQVTVQTAVVENSENVAPIQVNGENARHPSFKEWVNGIPTFYIVYRRFTPWIVAICIAYANGWSFARQQMWVPDPNVWIMYIIGYCLDLGIVAATQYIVSHTRPIRTVLCWMGLIVVSDVTQWFYYTLAAHAPQDLVFLRIAATTLLYLFCGFCLGKEE